jgi:hypothetical protein
VLPFIRRVAEGSEIRTPAAKEQFMAAWKTELELNMNSLNYLITPISEADFAINPQRMQSQISREFLPDLALQFRLGNNKPKHYFICALRPGSVTDYRKYLNMLRRIQAINSHAAAFRLTYALLLYMKRNMKCEMMYWIIRLALQK